MNQALSLFALLSQLQVAMQQAQLWQNETTSDEALAARLQAFRDAQTEAVAETVSDDLPGA